MYLTLILGLGQRRNVLEVVEDRALALEKKAVEKKGVAVVPKKVHVTTVRDLENANNVVGQRKEKKETVKDLEVADLKITNRLERTEHPRSME